MLNILSTPTFDTVGYVEVNVTADTTTGDTRRRISRIATLDGGAVINDGGYSDGDRILSLTWVADNADLEAAVKRMVELYPQIQISTRDGVYLAALESYTPGAKESSLRALVVSKMSA